jgi:WD40 repeat protein/DNA-binding SARP family transcriptional activator
MPLVPAIWGQFGRGHPQARQKYYAAAICPIDLFGVKAWGEPGPAGGKRVARDRGDADAGTESDGAAREAGREDAGADVGSSVRRRRRAVGLTQQELADRAQISLGMVRDLEQGRTRRPGRDSLAKLAGALGLDAARLQTLARSTPEPAVNGGPPPTAGLRLRVLGPVEAWRDGTRLDLGEPRQRAVLGLLALNPDVPVRRDTLIDAIWHDDPPGTAAHLVQSYVSRLRRALDPGRPPRDPGGLLVSGGTSYRLHPAQDQLDLLAFAQLASGARAAALAGEPAAACDAYEQALGLWRGEPAADVDTLRGHPAVLQLSRVRAAAVLDYAGLADQAGRADRVLSHLADLTAREPLNEKACARYMLTLAALGQQAAALQAYEELRLGLDEQLGVLPGPELAEAHLRVLRQEVPAAGSPAAAGSGPAVTGASHAGPGGTAPRPAPPGTGPAGGAPGPARPPPAAQPAGTTMSPGSPLHPAADTWVAAVHASDGDFDPIGTAVVVDANRVLTCAHVVVSADGTAREPLWVSFPMADRWPRRRVATVTVARSVPVSDLAVLVLAEPVPVGVAAAPLRCPKPSDLVGRAWWAFGFPDHDPVGDSAHGLVGAALALGWVRLDTQSHYLSRPGFSGGGLWSPDYQAVVGVVGPAHGNGGARAITLHEADLRFPEHRLGALANWSAEAAGEVALKQWGWTLARDPEGARHWRPRARGVSIDSERGYRFRGRTAALGQIAGWLDRPEPDRRVLVVTGSPGVGKSAVLGRIVTTADATIRASLPPGDEAVRADLGSVSCAVHAKAKTALEVAEEIARAASARLPKDIYDLVPAIRGVLEEQDDRRFNVIIDALDEAGSPAQARDIIDRVALPLAETCSDVGAQVVVGTRRRDDGGDLLGRFGGALAVIDLDDPEYFAEEDLAAYALACLRLAGDERPGNPYLDDTLAATLASRIALMADRNFLIAGLIARSHGLHDEVAADPDHLAVSATVDSALAAYLERLSPVAGLPADRALTALAFAEAPGLPATLWQLAVQAIDGAQVSAENLTRFARSSAANFLVEASGEEAGADHGAGAALPVYRLFHQALNDALLRARSDAMPRADDERALTLAFTVYGQLSKWENAPGYLLRSLPSHAYAAGLVEDLLGDDAYLLHADLRRLIQVADQAHSAQGHQRARLIRLTPRTIAASPQNRAALFSVTEALHHLGTSYRDGGHEAPYRAVWTSVKPRGGLAEPEGHRAAVYGVCRVTVAGQQLLASASGDGTIRIWAPGTGQQQAILEGHQDGIGDLCPVTVAGQELLASAGDDGTIRIWDPSTGQQRATLEGHQDWVNSVCPVTVAGQQLLASGGSDGTVRIWDPSTGQQRATLKSHPHSVWSVCSVAVAGRELLASAGDHGTVRIWDPRTGQQRATLEGHRDWVSAMSPVRVAGRELLASGGDEGTIRIWDPETGRPNATLEGHQDSIYFLCQLMVAGRELLASGGADGTIRIWDPSTGQQHAVLAGHRAEVNGLCPVTVAGTELLASAGSDGTVRIWDPRTGQQRVTLAGHQDWICFVCPVTVAGTELLASGGSDGTVRTWDPRTGQRRVTMQGHQDWVNSVSPVTVAGTELLASASGDGTVRIWDPGTGQQRAVLAGHQGCVNSVCRFTVAGQELLASGGQDGTVRIWDPGTGQQRATLAGHQGGVYSVCPVTASSQGLVASGGSDGTVRIWDPETGQQRAVLRGHRDGVRGMCPVTVAGQRLLASGDGDGMVRVWDPETGQQRAALRSHLVGINGVCSVTMAGRELLASVDDDGTVRIWDPGTGVCPLIVATNYPAQAATWVAE